MNAAPLCHAMRATPLCALRHYACCFANVLLSARRRLMRRHAVYHTCHVANTVMPTPRCRHVASHAALRHDTPNAVEMSRKCHAICHTCHVATRYAIRIRHTARFTPLRANAIRHACRTRTQPDATPCQRNIHTHSTAQPYKERNTQEERCCRARTARRHMRYAAGIEIMIFITLHLMSMDYIMILT